MQKKSEAEVQAEVRLKTSQDHGVVLWRNNVGAFQSKTGTWVRVGLANDSKQMNAVLKSADLIGWTPIEITPDMVGQTVAVFTSIEVKEEGYRPSGKKQLAHYAAQEKWRDGVLRDGGIAGIVDSSEAAGQLVVEWLERMEKSDV